MTYQIEARASQSDELLADLAAVSYRPAPSWLGSFQFRMYKPIALAQPCPVWVYDSVWEEARRLAQAVPEQHFNTLFVQRYLPGQNVRSHRDPRNNVGYTVIGLYGDFTATRFRVEETWAEQRPGDVFVLPCTIAGVQGPQHGMQWLPGSTGTRYAIILNTIC